MGNTTLARFGKGDILFKEGDTSRDMYIIRSGKVGIYKNRDNRSVLVAMVEKGNFVGEMSFVSGLSRSATAVAEEAVIASRIDTDILNQDTFSLNAWAVNVARVLADRIRRTTDLFVGEYTYDDEASSVTQLHSQTQNELIIRPHKDNSHGCIYLKGYLKEAHIEKIKEQIKKLSYNGCSEITLDFSDVPDIDNAIIDFLSFLTQNRTLYQNSTVTVKNVQLIRNKLISIKSIRELVKETPLPKKRVTQGDFLIRQGEDEQVMYVVKTGQFKIFREVDGTEIILGTAEADDVVGEMKLVAGGVRSASVKALQSSVVYCIQISEFYKNSYQIPSWFMELIRSLVDRLRKTNEMLELAVRRQSREDQIDSAQSQETTPMGIILDSSHPGKITLSGHFVNGNREYLSAMVNLLLKRNIIDITIDMDAIEAIDNESIRYLLKLYVYLHKKGGILQINGVKKDILYLFKQYDIEL